MSQANEFTIVITYDQVGAEQLAQSNVRLANVMEGLEQKVAKVVAATNRAEKQFKAKKVTTDEGAKSLLDWGEKALSAAKNATDLAGKVVDAAQAFVDFAKSGEEGLRVAASFTGDIEKLRTASLNLIDDTSLQKVSNLGRELGWTQGRVEALTLAAAKLYAEGFGTSAQANLEALLNGEAEALRKLGVAIDTSSEKFQGLSDAKKKDAIAAEVAAQMNGIYASSIDTSNLAASQAQTRMDNFVGDLQVMTYELLQSSGAFDVMQEFIRMLGSVLTENRPAIDRIAGALGTLLASSAEQAGEAIQLIVNVFGLLEPFLPILTASTSMLTSGLKLLNAVITPIVGWVQDLVGWFHSWGEESEFIGDALDLLVAAMTPLPSLVGAVADAFTSEKIVTDDLARSIQNVTDAIEEMRRVRTGEPREVKTIADAQERVGDAVTQGADALLGWTSALLDAGEAVNRNRGAWARAAPPADTFIGKLGELATAANTTAGEFLELGQATIETQHAWSVAIKTHPTFIGGLIESAGALASEAAAHLTLLEKLQKTSTARTAQVGVLRAQIDAQEQLNQALRLYGELLSTQTSIGNLSIGGRTLQGMLREAGFWGSDPAAAEAVKTWIEGTVGAGLDAWAEGGVGRRGRSIGTLIFGEEIEPDPALAEAITTWLEETVGAGLDAWAEGGVAHRGRSLAELLGLSNPDRDLEIMQEWRDELGATQDAFASFAAGFDGYTKSAAGNTLRFLDTLSATGRGLLAQAESIEHAQRVLSTGVGDQKKALTSLASAGLDAFGTFLGGFIDGEQTRAALLAAMEIGHALANWWNPVAVVAHSAAAAQFALVASGALGGGKAGASGAAAGRARPSSVSPTSFSPTARSPLDRDRELLETLVIRVGLSVDGRVLGEESARGLSESTRIFRASRKIDPQSIGPVGRSFAA